MENVNTYKKYCPNVFVAKCFEEHAKGDVIILTTKYGKEHENEVHNFLGKTNDGFYLYSITRCDGFNAQERAKNKADRLKGFASNAEKRSKEAYKKSDLSEEATGIVFGQPILVGHHSERRHRKTIERADNAMRKSIEEDKKANEYKRRSEYWEKKGNDINLSMPESLEYYEFKLMEATKKHKYLKDNPEKRAHSYSLTYANKAVKEMQKNLSLAVRLWGSDEEINQIDKEKKDEAESKAFNNQKKKDEIKNFGGFFAFNTDQFKEGYNNAIEAGHLDQGEKVTHIKAGLYMPSKNVKKYLNL